MNLGYEAERRGPWTDTVLAGAREARRPLMATAGDLEMLREPAPPHRPPALPLRGYSSSYCCSSARRSGPARWPSPGQGRQRPAAALGAHLSSPHSPWLQRVGQTCEVRHPRHHGLGARRPGRQDPRPVDRSPGRLGGAPLRAGLVASRGRPAPGRGGQDGARGARQEGRDCASRWTGHS